MYNSWTTYITISHADVSIADANKLTDELLGPDRSWEETRWGRIDQGRRELAAVLGKDLTMDMLARAIGLTQPSLSGWKSGGRPKPGSLEALARVFSRAGLERFTARFLDWGDQKTTMVAETAPAGYGTARPPVDLTTIEEALLPVAEPVPRKKARRKKKRVQG